MLTVKGGGGGCIAKVSGKEVSHEKQLPQNIKQNEALSHIYQLISQNCKT